MPLGILYTAGKDVCIRGRWEATKFSIAMLLISYFWLIDLKPHSNLSSKSFLNDLSTKYWFYWEQTICMSPHSQRLLAQPLDIHCCQHWRYARLSLSTASSELCLVKMLCNKFWNGKKDCFLVWIGGTQLLLFGYSLSPQSLCVR